MTVTGFLLLMVGIGIGGWTAAVLGWRRVLGLDVGPPHPALPVLVFAGPYRFVRHPRTLAVVLISLGTPMVREVLPVWLYGMMATAALLGAAWRDRQLLVRYGEAYRRYHRVVPFLVPRRPRSG
jgi:protein-S-isoprenylcysteine O-methyltransferase Ste14